MAKSNFDVLIVLGSIREKERYYRSIAAGLALNHNITDNLILSGGETKGVIEAESMKSIIKNEFKTINSKYIFIEDNSTDTASNISYSKQITIKHNLLNIGILTNEYHLKRCLKLGMANQLNVKGISVEELLKEFDYGKYEELLEYTKTKDMRSIIKLEANLNRLLVLDPKGIIPNFISKIYHKK